jgi:hypothetical protein
VRHVSLLILAAALAVMVLAATALADPGVPRTSCAPARTALAVAKHHARAHAAMLGVRLPARIVHSTCTRDVRRYVKRTWRQMRFPHWQGLGAKAWLPLARHAGWPASTMPMLAVVIHRESNGQPGCITGSYRGLLQIGNYNAPSCDLFNPYTNLRVGAQMFARLGWRPWASTAW